MKSKSESNHTKTGANIGDANGIWYVHAGGKKGDIKATETDNVSS